MKKQILNPLIAAVLAMIIYAVFTGLFKGDVQGTIVEVDTNHILLEQKNGRAATVPLDGKYTLEPKEKGAKCAVVLQKGQEIKVWLKKESPHAAERIKLVKDCGE